jgi:hypothetical protein
VHGAIAGQLSWSNSGRRLRCRGGGLFAVEHLQLGLKLLSALSAGALIDAPVSSLFLRPEEHFERPRSPTCRPRNERSGPAKVAGPSDECDEIASAHILRE